MLPTWFLVAFYVLCGVATGWLLVRLWRKNRPQRSPKPVATKAAVATPRPVEEKPAVVAEKPVPSSWERRPEAVPAAMPAAANIAAAAIALPRIRPEDTPLASDADLYFGPLTPALAAMMPDTDARREEIRRDLQMAGEYTPHAYTNFTAIRYAAMASLLILGGVLLVLAPANLEPFAIGAIVGGPILGWALPRLQLRNRAAKRKSDIEQAMPDLMDMMNMCVSQGLTAPDAIRRILPDLRQSHPALAQELRIVMEQASLGDLHQALKNFDQRIDVPEVHSFTSLLMQTDRMGTSVSDALATYSDSMRESLRQRADEKGNRATFRLLFPTVFCLMPAVFLFLLGPAIIGMADFFKSGGRDGLDQGSRVIERLNTQRTAN